MADLPKFEETEELPSFENTQEALPSFEDTSDIENNTEDLSVSDKIMSEISAPLKGAAIGAAIPSTVGVMGKGVKTFAEKMSPYTPEQLATISQNYDQFSAIDPQDTIQKVEGQFRSKNRIANEMEKEAYANLSEPLTKEEYSKAIIQSSLSNTKDVPTDTEDFKNTVEKLTPKRNNRDPLLDQMESQYKQYLDLKAREKVQNLKNASLGTIPQAQLDYEYTKALKEASANKNDFVFNPNLEKAKEYEQKAASTLLADESAANKATIKQFESKLAKDYPELSGKMYNSSSSGFNDVSVKKILDQYSKGDKLSGEEAYALTQKLRELGWTPGSEVSNEVAAAGAKATRDILGEKNPEFSEKMGQFSQQIKELKELEKAKYLKRDKSLLTKNSDEFINVTEDNAKKIFKDVAPNLYQRGINITDDAIERLAILKSQLPEKAYKELELAVLKSATLDPSKTLKISGIDTALAIMDPTFSALRIGTKGVKTPTGSINAYRFGDKVGDLLSRKVVGSAGIIGALAAGPLGIAAEVAGEGLDSEPSGATQDMPDYWLEKGIKNPEEQIQRAQLSSFKEGLPNQGRMDEVPSAYDKPETKQYKENVLKAKERGQLKDNYVTPLADKASDLEKLQQLQEQFRSMSGKGAEAMANTIDKSINGTDEEKIKSDFLLKQNPAIRNKLY
jgi:hypothetical protein